MRVVWIVLIIVYLTVGYVVSAVIDTLEGGEVEESFACWVLWPFLLIGYLVVTAVVWIGRRVSVWPLVLMRRLKTICKREERRRRREIRRMYAEAEHDRESGKDR